MISIIVPIYNAEKFLLRILMSIKNQTYSNFECILVDDGSNDGSADICNHFVETDDRFIYVRQNNKGVSAARNTGLSIVRGEYIAFCDADDVIEVDMYERLISLIEEGDADIASCGFVREKTLTVCKSTGSFPMFFDVPIKQFYNYDYYIDSLWNKVFKRELLIGLTFDENISYTEDQLFVAMALIKAKRMVVTKDIKYHYMVNDGSLSKGLKTFEFWGGHVTAMKKIYEMICDNKMLDDELRKCSFEKYIRSVFSLFRFSVRTRDKMLYDELLKKYDSMIQEFLSVTDLGVVKKLSYYTYVWSYESAILFHYYLRR